MLSLQFVLLFSSLLNWSYEQDSVITPVARSKKSAGGGGCPKDSVKFHRLGQTRFYIYDTKKSDDDSLHTSWKDAEKVCNSHDKALSLASYLDKVSTNAIIAKHLERLLERLEMKETVYWLGAKYNPQKDIYLWEPSGGRPAGLPVAYSNFFYHHPRPIGVGGHHGTSNTQDIWGSVEKYNVTTEETQCIAFTLPYGKTKSLGYQASWIERACVGKTHRRVLCENTNPSCEENLSRNPHVLTEDKEYYYSNGNWIFANRRFIVNWKPRQFYDAKAYCENYGLELFSPMPEDECLMPYLKVWAPVISTYHFWSSYSYHSAKHEFKDRNKKVIQTGAFKPNKYGTRTSKTDEQFCVTYGWTFEFKNETSCRKSQCSWIFYVLTPANCNSYVGTICQHPGADNTRVCDFHKDWMSNFQLAVDNTAIVEFGHRGSGFWRSTYKQTFGSRVCGDRSRQMIDSKTEYWKVEPVSGVDYLYDYEETYWVVDDETLFKYAGRDEVKCSVSQTNLVRSEGVVTIHRTLKIVNCLEWHFYLCEYVG